MGRPPHSGGPVFRFTQNEVVEMESVLQEVNNAIPPREAVCALAEKFSASAERVGKMPVQPKQVWNWFQNRRYAQRAKSVKGPGKLAVTPSPMHREDAPQIRSVAYPTSTPAGTGKSSLENPTVEFEAKSARDGAWYDVAAFISHRLFETSDPEVRVHFSGFGVEEDEWVNVINCVRQRSLPCEAGECVVVLPGDLILCFQGNLTAVGADRFEKEGKEQALYFDAHVLDAQRRRHDIRGCRCRFLVRYDHDQSEEIVPLRKICRRPETDYRLQASRAAGSMTQQTMPPLPNASNDSILSAQKPRKQRKLMDINTDQVTTVPLAETNDLVTMQIDTPAPAVENTDLAAPGGPFNEAMVIMGEAIDITLKGNTEAR